MSWFANGASLASMVLSLASLHSNAFSVLWRWLSAPEGLVTLLLFSIVLHLLTLMFSAKT